MIEITKSAEQYFARLVAQQEMDDIGLYLSVLNPGTPLAACDLKFHVAGQSGEKELEFDYEGFKLYVPASNEEWLQEAKIDFEDSATGGQLTINAPGIKGTRPDDSADLEEKENGQYESVLFHGIKIAHCQPVDLDNLYTVVKRMINAPGGAVPGLVRGVL